MAAAALAAAALAAAALVEAALVEAVPVEAVPAEARLAEDRLEARLVVTRRHILGSGISNRSAGTGQTSRGRSETSDEGREQTAHALGGRGARGQYLLVA
ncbi:exported hypothetical protein [Frankia sp. AiPs1]